MRYIKPPGKDAAFHFSVETYLMEQFPSDEPIFMIWQADNTAMLGSYQVAQAEVDLSYAKELNIQIVRRQSGGGTIFTDMGTLLYTLILPQLAEQSPREIVREAFAAPMIRALNKLGIPAELIGRNDILVDGKKVCGIAQHVRRGKVCTHGSLLYDT
ncbi:MAG: lipoate--protein ligase family protein, partial [Oscillospiraceae bacterium]|nr:lipoate--protein ligase family protein [Oscillospiraceae bacterium]